LDDSLSPVDAASYGQRVEEPYVYPIEDRPDVEVLVDGTWCPGEARMRTQRADGLHYNVSWHRDSQTYLDTFHERDVRLDTVDRSHGRNQHGVGLPQRGAQP